MIDLQAIFVRDVAELNQINFIAVLRLDAVDSANVLSVKVNDLDAKFIKALDGRTIFAHLPNGVPYDLVSKVVLRRDVGGDYTENEHMDLGGEVADPNAAEGGPVGFFGGVLQLRGDDFRTAARVKVNNTDVPFSIVSRSEIMCLLPDRASVIDSVDVITTSKTINRRTYFEYMIGEDVRVVAGTQKLVQQFMKLLLTTTGTDVFRPTTGGDLQQFVGINFSPKNPSMVVAQVTMRIVQCGLDMTLRQTVAGIPPDERLSDVQVLEMSVDPEDPTIMQVSLRLNTYGGRTAQVSTLIGTAVESAVDQVAANVQSAGLTTGGGY